MRSETAVETAIDDSVRGYVAGCIQTGRRAGRPIVALVDVTERAALAPETVRTVLTGLVAEANVPVRRVTPDQFRWRVSR